MCEERPGNAERGGGSLLFHGIREDLKKEEKGLDGVLGRRASAEVKGHAELSGK